MNESNDDQRLAALFAVARAQSPDTSPVEFGFETRLMARLKSREETGAIWGTVSWRLVPFFAACVVALTLWQSRMAADTDDVAIFAGLEHPEAVDLWNSN
jgi:hypothetical protein